MPDVTVRSCGDERGVCFDFGGDVEVVKGVVFECIDSEGTAYQEDE